MRIYKLAQFEEKELEWKCPNTGIAIRASFVNDELMDEYRLYHRDGSFIDVFDNFWHARNWAKKHLDRDCKIPTMGVRLSSSIRELRFSVKMYSKESKIIARYCAWCGKHLDGEDVGYQHPNVSHCMCDDCLEKEMAQFREDSSSSED